MARLSKDQPEAGLYWCHGCAQLLPKANFYVSKTIKKGVRSKCKPCDIAASRKWNDEHPERFRENFRRHAATPEAKKTEKAWHDAHREHLTAYMKKWRTAHPAENKKIVDKYRRNNLEKKLIANREREILEGRSLPGWANRKVIRAIYATAKEITRRTGVPHDVDHIIPLRGRYVCGLHVETNLQIITAKENRLKHNRFEDHTL